MSRSKKCAIIGYAPEVLKEIIDDVQKENVFLRHVNALVLEAYHNECDEFHIGLRRGCELWIGESIISIRDLYETMSICHVQAYKGYHNCTSESELNELKHVSDLCDNHVHISRSKVEPDKINDVYSDYILNKTDMVIAVYSPKVIDPFLTPLTKAIKHNKTQQLIVIDPFDENFTVKHYNKPKEWLTGDQYRHHIHNIYRSHGI